LQDQELIYLARYLGEALLPDLAAHSMDLAEFASHYGQVKSRAVAEFILDCKSRALIAAGRSDLAWQVATAAGADLPGWLAGSAFRRLILYLRAFVALGVDLAAVTPTLTAALAKTRASRERFHELHLLGLTAWQQLQLQEANAARATAASAVALAQATGYVRVLLDLPALAPLLPGHGVGPAPKAHLASSTRAGALTEQELTVLRLLAAERTYGEIAAACVVSVNTVRTHVRHIYRKLGVGRRDQAIAEARRRAWLA
jgi:LuxR family maltose regulon positive regulatory protein